MSVIGCRKFGRRDWVESRKTTPFRDGGATITQRPKVPYAIAYKAANKDGEFVMPGFGKLVKQKRKARTGFNPKTQQKIKIPAKTVIRFRVFKVAKDAILGAKK